MVSVIQRRKDSMSMNCLKSPVSSWRTAVMTLLRAVVVCHCFRRTETSIRIISARVANRAEERAYWEMRR
jgi:uncharacterized DUF497 family protein